MIDSNGLMSVAGLPNQVFKGFVRVANLCHANRNEIPTAPGVYIFLRDCAPSPEFLKAGSGGNFKNKDPNVPLSRLTYVWVESAFIVYIGQTGRGRKGTLKKRIGEMISFGQGTRVGHWGGRLDWQLRDANLLLVCWKGIRDADPGNVEKDLIDAFKSIYLGRRPLANLRNGGRSDR